MPPLALVEPAPATATLIQTTHPGCIHRVREGTFRVRRPRSLLSPPKQPGRPNEQGPRVRKCLGAQRCARRGAPAHSDSCCAGAHALQRDVAQRDTCRAALPAAGSLLEPTPHLVIGVSLGDEARVLVCVESRGGGERSPVELVEIDVDAALLEPRASLKD